ncbi:hypothetical protein [Rhodopirellula bahusiensis]|uniref:hypothetical protein n=1 Tax=Rhodopirellula bahusiensis TaxID=2014065 RepID=UPI001E40689F|nr:hypothetical protein [Rhodopirellula bahusiensis]
MKDRLAEAVARLNPDLPQSAVDDVVHVVANTDHPSLEQNNRQLHRLYTNRVKVEYASTSSTESARPSASPRSRLRIQATKCPRLAEGGRALAHAGWRPKHFHVLLRVQAAAANGSKS